MLTKNIYTEANAMKDEVIQVKVVTEILEDGVVISRANHRSMLTPDMEENDFPEGKLKKIAKALWTKEVKDAYKDKIKDA